MPRANQPFRTDVVTVTPMMAHEWLLTNHELNRNIRQVQVQKFAAEMRKGNWHLTGEPIQFSKKGVLLNGQHRLHACIQADSNFKTVVVYGVDDKTMHVLDSGVSRTYGDVFKLEGITNASRLSSMTRRIMGWERGLWNNRDIGLTSRDELVDYAIKHHDELQEAHTRGERIYRKQRLSLVLWATFVYKAAEIDDDFAEMFTNKLADPTTIDTNETALKAFDTWCRNAVGRRLRPTEQLVASAYAWNSWITGHQRKLIKVHPDQVIPPALEGGETDNEDEE